MVSWTACEDVVVLTIDQNGFRFASAYSPIRYQFSVDGSSNWHDEMSSNDKYRRDSLDGGTTWGAAYQFKGTNGRNGSDASVTYDNMLKALQKAADTKTSFITADAVGSPTIYGAKIYGAEIYAGGVDDKGGQIIGLTDSGIKVFNGHGFDVLTIHEVNGGAELQTGFNYLTLNSPYVNIGRAKSTDIISFYAKQVDFAGVQEVDFTGVKTNGLHLTLA